MASPKMREYKVIIGHKLEGAQRRAFESAIVRGLCRHTGGCTVVNGDGYWLSDAAEFKDVYEGQTHVEHAFSLTYTVTSAMALTVYMALKQIVSKEASRYSAGIEWVHVQRTDIQCAHFNINKGTWS